MKITMFKNKDGKRVPSVSTIIGQLDKPGLMYWAHKLGLEGITDLRGYRDALGQAGRLAHALSIPLLSGVTTSETLKSIQGDYEPEELELAAPIMKRFSDWAEKHTFRTKCEETSFISEIHQFGGRIDWLGEMDDDDALKLLDFKFAKALYPEAIYQMAAYHRLLLENGIYSEVKIIRFGRNEDEGFEIMDLPEETLDAAWKVFLRLRDIYELAKLLPKLGKVA